MKIVKIWGGLGNQLFQYYFSLYLMNDPLVKCDCFYFTHYNCDSFVHNLGALNLELIQADKCELKRLDYAFETTLRYRVYRFVYKWFKFLSSHIVVENDLIKFNLNKKAIIYDGYWQKIKYVEATYNYHPIIFEQFIWGAEQLSILNRIKESNSVSIHVRRGDKLELRNRFRYFNLKMSYYENSINWIKTKIDNPVFFVFSDDIDFVKRERLFSEQNSVVYVSGITKTNSVIFEFMCMSKCDSNIISNSTFSWWGAWINAKEDKIVIAPKRWYRFFNKRRTENLLPKNWIVLK